MIAQTHKPYDVIESMRHDGCGAGRRRWNRSPAPTNCRTQLREHDDVWGVASTGHSAG